MISMKEHVLRLFKDIDDSERKRQMIDEITHNLNEKVEDLMASGKSLEDATNKAIVEFGDIEEIKKELGVSIPTCKPKNYGYALGFSIWGSALIIILFLFINFYYTPNTIWFVYPTFAILWWPLSLVFVWLKNRKEN